MKSVIFLQPKKPPGFLERLILTGLLLIQKIVSLPYISTQFDKASSFLAANYTNFRGLKKKFALIGEIRGKDFTMYSSKKIVLICANLCEILKRLA